MLKNIFSLERVVQVSQVDPGGFLEHDDLVSIICVKDERMGRSILFQSLVTNNREGQSAVYITRKPLDDLPEPVEDMPTVNPLLLDVVTFVYIDSANQLNDYLAELHTLPALPNVLIIQDMSFYINQYQGINFNTKCAKLFALVKETAKFLATKLEKIGEAKLFITMNPTEENLAVVKKNFRSLWLINETSNPSEYRMELCKGSSLSPCSLLFQSLFGSLCNPRFIK